MKPFILLLTIYLLLIACNDTASNKPKVDTHSSSDINQNERLIQIDNAKNNQALLAGQWQVTDVRNKYDEMTNLNLKDMNFDKVTLILPIAFKLIIRRKNLTTGYLRMDGRRQRTGADFHRWNGATNADKEDEQLLPKAKFQRHLSNRREDGLIHTNY